MEQTTVVIFTGDNGSSTGGTENRRAVPAGKGRTTERGVHLPLFARLPGTLGGRSTEALEDFSNIFPTMLDLAGLALKAGDGHSWVSLLRQAPGYVPRPWIYAQRDFSRTARDQRFKLDSVGGFIEVAIDPDQKRPVIPTRDPATAAAFQTLQTVLATFPADARTPPFPDYPQPHARILGPSTSKLRPSRMALRFLATPPAAVKAPLSRCNATSSMPRSSASRPQSDWDQSLF